jgi:hypothetical protein
VSTVEVWGKGIYVENQFFVLSPSFCADGRGAVHLDRVNVEQ